MTSELRSLAAPGDLSVNVRKLVPRAAHHWRRLLVAKPDAVDIQ